MAQFRFERGLWGLAPRSEWTPKEIEIDIEFRMRGQNDYLVRSIEGMNEDARNQGYRRRQVLGNMYGWALYDRSFGPGANGRVSEIFARVEDAIRHAQEWEASKPGFHFVDYPSPEQCRPTKVTIIYEHYAESKAMHYRDLELAKGNEVIMECVEHVGGGLNCRVTRTQVA